MSVTAPADPTSVGGSATGSTATTSERTIKPRRIDVDYPGGDIPRHFAGHGDLVMSHVIAMLSAMFPNGEDFFVRSVRAYRDDIEDETLQRQVKGFIGQESMHGREHRELNDRLAELGYPTKGVDRFVDKSLRLRERLLSPENNLAATAALEHYTATLAEVLMENSEARDQIDSDEVRQLLLWHALEESEHKAVAFDVYQAVGGSHRMRAMVMNLTTIGFLGFALAATAVSLAKDPASRDLGRLRRSLARQRTSPWLTRSVRRRIRSYNRRDFHPDDWDATALLAEWSETLFGAQGAVPLKGDREPATA